MLTRRSKSPMSLLLILLLSLALTTLVPFTDYGYVTAAEQGKTVDITQNDVDSEEVENDENQEENTSKPAKEKNSDADSEENSDEISDENEDFDEDSVNNEENSDEDAEDEAMIACEVEEDVEYADENADVDIDDDDDVDADADDNADADADDNVDADADDETDSDHSINNEEKTSEKNINIEDADEDAIEEETISAQEEETEDADAVVNAAASDEEAADEDLDEDADAELDADADEETDETDEDNDSDKKKDKESSSKTESNADLNGQFPASYQPLIEALQAEHPNWTFIPAETGVKWEDALDKEDKGSTSLISPSAPKAQKEKSNKKYDGKWSLANRATIAYYMDPRNFLSGDSVYQFLQQTYDENSQNVDTVAAVIDGSFMDGKSPDGDFETFQACIDDAGEEAGVNANVLAAMIIEEQGWDGSKLSSGKDGYYNFFNIGAWTTGDMSSTERGLWYAKGSGEGETSYERPWDSPYKAILGGAQFYYEKYVSQNQDTFYTKKFNVMNGVDSIGEHQYMTNVQGAADEGKLLSRAYESSDVSATFVIPVYQDMPEKACELPE